MASPNRGSGRSNAISWVVGGLVAAVAIIALLMYAGDRDSPATTAGGNPEAATTGSVTAPAPGTPRPRDGASPATTTPPAPVPDAAPAAPNAAPARP